MESNDDNRPGGELLVYQGQGFESPVQVRLEGETVWLSQKLLAELFQKDVRTINEHITNIYMITTEPQPASINAAGSARSL